MQIKLSTVFVLGASLAFAVGLAVTPSLSKTELSQGNYAAPLVTHISGGVSGQNSGRANPLAALKLADTHADICLANEQQCLTGCDGATSCSNQCAVNYQGCMSQGG
jgi:hypothetical protein